MWQKLAEMRLVLLVLALLIGNYSQLGAQDTQTGGTLIFNWESEDGSPGDGLHLKADGSFIYTEQEAGKAESGFWRVEGDSLTLMYELLPAHVTVDSVIYQAEDNIPQLILYQNGREVARHTGENLSSARREVAYRYTIQEAGALLVLEGPEGPQQFKGPAALIRAGFSFMDIVRGLLGLASMLGLAFLFSQNRKAIDWKLVRNGMILQLSLGVLVLYVPGVKQVFDALAGGFVALLQFTREGSLFIFGDLMQTDSFGYIFAFQVLPTIIFFSALMSLLYYLGVLQRVVYGFAWLMSRFMNLSGAESLAAAGNIFLGQTESPLLVRPYLEKMTRSEIMALMTGGMATIAGGVFAAYVGYLGGDDPEAQRMFATHLLTASLMSAPAALVVAKMLVPETEEVNKDVMVPKDRLGANVLDAISNGILDGLRLAVNVGVMLLVFIALMDMVNFVFAEWIGSWSGLNEFVARTTDGRYQEFDLQYIMGLIFAPLAWLIGVPAEDMMVIGQLLGEKTIINEFVAYASLGESKTLGVIVQYKSVLIATYALCGFANFSSIGIQIGGIGALAPGKRKLLSELGLRSLLGGTLAAFMTAAIAGMMAYI